MMKRILCLLAVLLLTFTAAAAEPRYPDKAGVTTDVAAVFSVNLLEDLRKLDKRLDKADTPRLYIATVDFLDGTDVQTYADALFDRWNLDDDEMLLLIAVGEESYALSSGKNADRLIAPSTQAKLLTSAFQEPFLEQQYDAAIAAYVPGLVREINKSCGTSIRTDDLFRNASSSLIVNWAGNLSTATGLNIDSALQGADNMGWSVLKVILIVVLLMLLFGSFRKVSRRNGQPVREQKRTREPRQYFKPYKRKGPVPQYFKPKR